MNTRSIFIAMLVAGTLLIASCIPSETVVTIVSPPEGAKVDQFVTIDGESQLLPANSVIWVVVYLPVTGRYYPQNFPADVQANGEWSSTAYIGQQNESGLAADIIAVAADGSAQNVFNTYLIEAKDKNDFSGLEQLPKGVTIYDRVSVIRR